MGKTMRARMVWFVVPLLTAGCYAGTDPDEAIGPTTRVDGEIAVLETSLNGFESAGSGMLVTITLTPSDQALLPSFEQQPGSPFACKVYERTPEQFLYPGADQGQIGVTLPGEQELPPCAFVPEQGYRCASVSGAGGDIEALSETQWVFSDPAATFGTDEVGRHIKISGATEPGNNGVFMIVAADESTVTYINEQPGAAAESATSADYQIIAGLGPAGQEDPLTDDASLEIALTAGDDSVLDSFSYTLEDVGDGFTLEEASRDVISNIPMDGSPFTISCDTAGGCGTALGSGILLVTTDGTPDPSLPPFLLPPPVNRSVLINCVFLTPQVTVPAEASAYIRESGATRISANYVRVNLSSLPQTNGTIQLLGGHSVLGVTGLP
jgi:hypothetical protein